MSHTLTPEKIEATVIEVVANRFEVQADTLTRETHLFDDLQADDLALIELELALEERLYEADCHLDIPDGNEAKWMTVGDVIDEVTRLVAGAAGAASGG